MAESMPLPRHHPEPEELLAYAAGNSEPWLSTLMACHLTLCPSCRRDLAVLEEVAGDLFDEIEAESTSGGADGPTASPDSQVLAAIHAGAPLPAATGRGAGASQPTVRSARVPDAIAHQVPRPLHGFFADEVPRFRFLAPGLKHIPLTLSGGGRPVRLVRFRPGFVIPEHAHGGLEWLLILRGELTDTATGERFVRGDVSLRSEEDVHGQVIGKREPCVAVLAHIGAPIPRTWAGRILSRIVRL